MFILAQHVHVHPQVAECTTQLGLRLGKQLNTFVPRGHLHGMRVRTLEQVCLCACVCVCVYSCVFVCGDHTHALIVPSLLTLATLLPNKAHITYFSLLLQVVAASHARAATCTDPAELLESMYTLTALTSQLQKLHRNASTHPQHTDTQQQESQQQQQQLNSKAEDDSVALNQAIHASAVLLAGQKVSGLCFFS